MRDSGRIDYVLDRLREVWSMEPDLRLGQLVVNATATQRSLEPCPEVFYLEDERMVAGLMAIKARLESPTDPHS